MKTYHERTEDVLVKLEKKRKTRRVTRLAITVTVTVILALVLFLPYNDQPPSVRQHAGSPYYELIQKINAARFEKPAYDNLFSQLTSGASDLVGGNEIKPGSPNYSGAVGENPNGTYQEITDNQVAGVIEGDLIKRSDKYIYYLHLETLGIYSIEGADSKQVGAYSFRFDGMGEISYYTGENREMYLSEDCTTVTLVLSGYGDFLEAGKKGSFLCLIDLDVTDPANIREIGRLYLTGTYHSSRLVNGKLLLMSQYSIRGEIDFAKPETYIPRIGQPGSMECLPADSVISPDTLDNTTYTVVTLLDQKTLEVTDNAAFLSYTNDLYVTGDSIFATRTFVDSVNTRERVASTDMTEIACMSHSTEGLTLRGSVQVEGSVKNQYSMDVKDGILRVVTSTRSFENKVYYKDGQKKVSRENTRNANLYCIRLSDWEVLAKVESFAPEGETVESVRFDGDYAYVCTAEVVTLTDPVYFFDLSDLSNITWKATGAIDGYSTSLVDFGGGNLIGIGFGGDLQLKIEAYRETENGVESICAYEQDARFNTDYKSYYIDRENQLIGLSYCRESGRYTDIRYVLLHFDGIRFHELSVVPLMCNGLTNSIRGVVVDGWLYVLADSLYIQKVW